MLLVLLFVGLLTKKTNIYRNSNATRIPPDQNLEAWMMGGREAGRDSEAIWASLEVMWRGLDVLWLPWIHGGI